MWWAFSQLDSFLVWMPSDQTLSWSRSLLIRFLRGMNSHLIKIWLDGIQTTNESGWLNSYLMKMWLGGIQTRKEFHWMASRSRKHLIGWIPTALKSDLRGSRPRKNMIGWIPTSLKSDCTKARYRTPLIDCFFGLKECDKFSSGIRKNY